MQFQTRHRPGMGRIFSVPLMENQRGHDPRKLFFVLLIAIGLSILLANLGFAMGSKNKQEGKGLYFYSGKEISRFLKEIGYPNYSIKASWDVSRNSNGTVLRFSDWSNNKVLVVSSDAFVKEVDLPGKATWSKRSVWFNNKHQVAAWLEGGKVYFSEGISKDPSWKVDESSNISGKYFIKSASYSSDTPLHMLCKTELYSIENPDLPLVEISACGIRDIFLKDGKIILFANDFDGQVNRIRDSPTAHVFEAKDDKLIEVEKINIKRPKTSPAPFYVIDFSPWKDEILFVDVYDFPSRSKWYVYNLKTHEMKKIGYVPFSGGWGFYLQCDILKKVTKKFCDGKGK